MNFLDSLFAHFITSPAPEEIDQLPFGAAIWPWIGAPRASLKEAPGLELLSPQAKASLEKSLLTRLSHTCAPSFVLEMAISQNFSPLEGNTPKERYSQFVKQRLLNENNLRAFFQEYHELERMVTSLVDLWLNQAKELLARLKEDQHALAKEFNQGKPLGKVTHLDPSLGDPHNGGRSVYLLTFESGVQLFYKPKESHIVAAYHTLLKALSTMGLKPELKGYSLFVKEGYAWEEKVEQKECQTAAQVSAYFERAGQHLCLLYLLDGNDVHHENIIASGEYPILIDLETLFHAQLRTKELRPERYVLKTGLLPSFVMGALGKKGVDISGLGGQEGQDYPTLAARWEHLNTDAMHLIHEVKQSEENQHRVFLQGKKQAAKDHIPEILEGFKKTYLFLMEHKIELLEGPLKEMSFCKVRFILRATRFYFHLLNRLRDPGLLLNPELKTKEFELLAQFLPDLEHLPLIEEEIRALNQGDIPSFSTKPLKKDIYVGDKMVVKEAFDHTAFESVSRRLDALSLQDLQLQELFIKQSFYVKTQTAHSQKEKYFDASGPFPQVSATHFLEEATKIGEALKKSSFCLKNGSRGWIDLEPNPLTEQYHLQPISDNLYGGKAGIALFFAALAKVTKEKEWREFAANIFAEAREKIKTRESSRMVGSMGIGAFTGVSGLSYALLQSGRLLNQPQWIIEARQLLLEIQEEHICQDQIFDVIGGSAGLLLVLTAFGNDPDLLSLGHLAANHLCKQGKTMPQGIAWERLGGTPFLGYSHGSAGISHALFKWGTQTKTATYIESAKQALTYERSQFDVVHKNWPLLHQEEGKIYPTRWCHGATGVGLGKLATLACFEDERVQEEITIALETTMKKLHEGAGINLCCSILGRLEFLLEAAKQLKEPAYEKSAHQALPAAFFRMQHVKETQKFLSPGLMQGQAGSGYTLLRLIDPTLPQVLILS